LEGRKGSGQQTCGNGTSRPSRPGGWKILRNWFARRLIPRRFLDHISLVMDNDEAAEGDRVSLMTLYAAKELVFDTVLLTGWEEGLFLNQRAMVKAE
jgi:superfamily I DNA/RNA helicase